MRQILEGFPGTLLSDGCSAYEHHLSTDSGASYAQCWSRIRRLFKRAHDAECVDPACSPTP